MLQIRTDSIPLVVVVVNIGTFFCLHEKRFVQPEIIQPPYNSSSSIGFQSNTG